ncbi:unnamed protein product [Bursaphelenchus xylophilus]|uniref:(pine wood nematode) hypothetical protein n=1 Tax=Bursaphelenchus xylophilus TaxID=6326 RepID=A0A1I7RMM6_BURXY|nr:unnamed protein product [Bursaphelenchus xylophilus]CAG9125665.1 unnamed protein product [Bursaphelenchus xylophilus]
MKTDWRSIYILTIVGFLGSFKIAAMSSGLWAYMKLVDPEVTESFYGALHSTANFSNLFMSLLAGILCNKLGDTKLCIVIGKSLWIFAVVSYLAVELMPHNAKFWFLSMEVCFGLSMGLMSVSRTHVAMASTEKERPRAVSLMTLSITVGMAVGPAIMVLMSLLKYPGYEMPFGVHMNLYTAPMYLLLVTTIISVILLVCCFDGTMRVPVRNKDSIILPKGKGRTWFTNKTSYDKFAVFLCCLTRVVQSTSMLFLINVGGPYMMTAFGWSSKELLRYNSIMHTAIGILGIAICVSYITKFTQKYLSDRRAIIIGTALKLSYYVITYPYPFLEKTIPYEIRDENGTIIENGCSERFDWCATTPLINAWVYCIAKVLCFGTGFPLIMLNLDVLYSKVLGNIKQGTMQGIFLVSGEVLTIIGPIIFTTVYEATGPAYIWQFNIVTITGILILWVVYYDRMISATRRKENKRQNLPPEVPMDIAIQDDAKPVGSANPI